MLFGGSGSSVLHSTAMPQGGCLTRWYIRETRQGREPTNGFPHGNRHAGYCVEIFARIRRAACAGEFGCSLPSVDGFSPRLRFPGLLPQRSRSQRSIGEMSEDYLPGECTRRLLRFRCACARREPGVGPVCCSQCATMPSSGLRFSGAAMQWVFFLNR
jgi:hypothetical protein